MNSIISLDGNDLSVFHRVLLFHLKDYYLGKVPPHTFLDIYCLSSEFKAK